MQVIINPILSAYQILALGVGLTSVTYIAIILTLDMKFIPEPVLTEELEKEN